jgi:hypothetical protein
LILSSKYGPNFKEPFKSSLDEIEKIIIGSKKL